MVAWEKAATGEATVTVRYIDENEILFPVEDYKDVRRWRGGGLAIDMPTDMQWAGLETGPDDKAGGGPRLPVAFDGERGRPFTDSDWKALVALENMKRGRASGIALRDMMAMAKTIHPMTRYPNKYGPIEGMPFAFGLVQHSRSYSTPQILKVLDTMEHKAPLAGMAWKGNTLVDAALRRRASNAPLLADSLENRGVSTGLLAPAENVDAVFNLLDMLIHMRWASSRGNGSQRREEEEKIKERAWQWLDKLDASQCLAHPTGDCDQAYQGSLQGWLLFTIVTQRPSIHMDQRLVELATRGGNTGPDEQAIIHGSPTLLGDCLTVPPGWTPTVASQAMEVKKQWLARNDAVALEKAMDTPCEASSPRKARL